MTKLILRKGSLPTTPTPSDPLANIDNTLITGGKDGVVSAREVESAGNRAALTPSPHRGEKHVGPGMWVHVNPDGGSTGRGSRVTGQDDPVPELHNNPQYSSPEQENNISQSTPPIPSLPNTHLRNADGRATQLANQGYDFANPHVAYNTTKKLLEHLHSRGREEQANALQEKMDKEHRLSLYPWEIADEDPHFLDTYVPHYQGELRIDPEDEGYKRNQAGIQKSIARPHGLLSLPRREHEVDPVELRERKKRAKERAKQKRKNKFHPHRMRKDDDKRASFVDDDALNPDESDIIEPEHGEPDDGTAVRGSIRDKKTSKGIYIAKAAQTPVSVNQHVLGLSQESPVSLTHIDKRMGQGLLPPSQRKTNPFDADKRGGARLITAKSTYINGYPPNSTFYSHGNDHLAYLRGDFSNARRRSFNANGRMPNVLTNIEKNAVYAGFTPSDEKKAIASNEVASDDRLYDGMEAGLTHHMEPNGFHETLARNDKSPLIDPEHPKHQEMLHRLRNEWANEAMPLTEYNQKFPNGHPEERLPNNQEPTWQTEILLPNTAKKGKYLYAAHPLMQKLGMIDHEGNILDHNISGAEYSEHLKNAINEHFNSRIMKSEEYEPVTSVHRVMDKEEQAKRNPRWNDNPLVYKSQHIIAFPLEQSPSIQKAKPPAIQPISHMTNFLGQSSGPEKINSIRNNGLKIPDQMAGGGTNYYNNKFGRPPAVYGERIGDNLKRMMTQDGATPETKLHASASRLYNGYKNTVYAGLQPHHIKDALVSDSDFDTTGDDTTEMAQRKWARQAKPLTTFNKNTHEVDPRHDETRSNEVLVQHDVEPQHLLFGQDILDSLPSHATVNDYHQALAQKMKEKWNYDLPIDDVHNVAAVEPNKRRDWAYNYQGKKAPYGRGDYDAYPPTRESELRPRPRPNHLPELTKSSIWNSNPLVSSIVMTNPFGESEYRANKRKMGKSDTSIGAVGMHIPHAFDSSPSPQKVQRSLQSIAANGMTPQPPHLHGDPTKYYDETLNRGSHIYAQRAAEGLVKQGRGKGIYGEHAGEENHVYLGLTPDDEKKSSVADMYNYGPDYVDKHPLDEWNQYYHEIDPRHVSEKRFNEVMIPHHIPRERIILGRDVIKNLPVNYSHDDYIQALHNHMVKQWGRGLPLKDMETMKNLPDDDLHQWGQVYKGRKYPIGMSPSTQSLFLNLPRLESSFAKNKLLLKSGTKGSNSKKAQQDVRPSHVYKARDGHGYRNMNVVPVGTPHGSGTRQEFPDPSWRLDMNGNVSFSSRDFKRHIRHDHTILPVEDSEHGRHNLLMLHALSAHARSTADRNGDTNGFWDRLPTPEEVPFYPNDKGEHDIEAYQAIRSIQHGSEDAARRNSKHSNAAEGWRHYAKTVANAIEQHTGKHPEMHLLARDVEKITQIYTQAKSLGKELESYARMKTIPQPGVNFHLRCDRTLLPEKYREYLNAADESMHSNCLALGSLFTTSEAHDSRDVDFAKIQRRAWIQLAKDIEVSAAARTLTIPRLEDLVHTQWSDSTATHSGTPFYQLSQSHLSMNFSRMVPEKRQRIVERQLAMTFEKLLRSVNKAPSGHAPDEIRNKRLIDYLDKLRPVLTTNIHSFYTIASVGAFTPETIFDSSGLSHNSIADEQNISGMQRAVFLHDGGQMIPDDITFVFHPSVYETKGAVGMPSSAVALDKKNHIALKNQLYRPTRTNRAILHMLTSLEPAVVAERWNDIVQPKFTHIHTQIIAIPEKLSLSDVSHIILHKDLPPDSVETIREILQRDYRHIKVVQGTYEDIFS